MASPGASASRLVAWQPPSGQQQVMQTEGKRARRQFAARLAHRLWPFCSSACLRHVTGWARRSYSRRLLFYLKTTMDKSARRVTACPRMSDEQARRCAGGACARRLRSELAASGGQPQDRSAGHAASTVIRKEPSTKRFRPHAVAERVSLPACGFVYSKRCCLIPTLHHPSHALAPSFASSPAFQLTWSV